MLIDTLNDGSERHAARDPLLGQALRFLRRTDLHSLPLGRTPIDGTHLYASLDSAQGRRRDQAPLENHRRYLDVHYLLEGEEEIGWKPARECSLRRSEYDEAKDVEFFDDEPIRWALLRPGSFLVAWPDEAHAPMVSRSWVKKVVVKVELGRGG